MPRPTALPDRAVWHPVPAPRSPPLNARFPAEVASALKHAGWHPGRWQIGEAETWADTLAAHDSPDGHRHSVFPAAVEAWAEFGGIAIDLAGAGERQARTPFRIDPMCGLHQPRTLADLGRALDTPVAPLGEENDGRALLVIDALGRVHSLDHSGEWYLGPTVDHAVTALVMGAAPERLQTAARVF
ncbi:SUKH-3 domain-containing protein [Streptomyces sp. NPDC092296]|uniref:SUKH-3 domain-containing protein n=1 Tax=Streptomyces sp. NPDC092296 TaxID=3366012 RepID=UPI00380C6727